MKIAILGAGSIGTALARAFTGHGHHVTLANSRAPETIRDLAASLGASAAFAADAVRGVDAIITALPLSGLPMIRPLLASVPDEVPVIDTGNYQPLRDGHIAALDNGQVEAL